MIRILLSALLLPVGGTALHAGEADVIDATATRSAGNSWRIDATVRHADTGWDHYADAFEILAPDGTILATRVLHHPHVNEQPFTRSQTVTVPEGVSELTIRAVDSVHGRGGLAFTVTLDE